MVPHTGNPSTQEAGAEGLLWFKASVSYLVLKKEVKSDWEPEHLSALIRKLLLAGDGA